MRRMYRAWKDRRRQLQAVHDHRHRAAAAMLELKAQYQAMPPALPLAAGAGIGFVAGRRGPAWRPSARALMVGARWGLLFGRGFLG